MIKYKISQGSEAWFAARAGRITGTRFSALMAKESTKTYKDMVTNIATEIITGRIDETYTNATMEKGIETEPYARDEYKAIFDVDVEECGFVIPDEDDKYHEWVGVSPDGMLTDGLLEIKCPLMKTHFGYISADKLPTEYRHQVQGQLFVTKLGYCDFMSYVPEMKPFIIRVYPDLDLHKEYEHRLDYMIKKVKIDIETYEKYNYHDTK